jgi:hypothetical protein
MDQTHDAGPELMIAKGIAVAPQQNQDGKDNARDQDAVQILKELPHFSTPETVDQLSDLNVATFYRMRYV